MPLFNALLRRRRNPKSESCSNIDPGRLQHDAMYSISKSRCHHHLKTLQLYTRPQCQLQKRSSRKGRARGGQGNFLSLDDGAREISNRSSQSNHSPLKAATGRTGTPLKRQETRCDTRQHASRVESAAQVKPLNLESQKPRTLPSEIAECRTRRDHNDPCLLIY